MDSLFARLLGIDADKERRCMSTIIPHAASSAVPPSGQCSYTPSPCLLMTNNRTRNITLRHIRR